MMAVRRLTFATLGELAGGFVPLEFDRLLGQAVEDVEQRPGIVKEREITIRVKIAPSEATNQRGVPAGVDVGLTVFGAVPKSEVRAHSLRGELIDVGKGELQQALLFNPGAPENARQLTLDDAPANGGKGGQE